MNATTLADILDAKLDRGAESLPFEEELALIERAQSGDEDAYVALLRQYAHGLRNLMKTEHSRAGGLVDADETRANVLLAFAEALAECDGTTRIAAKLRVKVYDVATEHHLVGALSVPTRTRQRYMQALREAGPDGDAEATAAELGMSREAFLAVRDAIGARSIEDMHATRMARMNEEHSTTYFTSPEQEATGITPERSYASVEQRATVERAFAAVDELTGDIIRDAYGFTEYDPIPDAEIAHRRGFSRSKVQRIRTEGIVTMRRALGVDEEAGA